MKGIILAAGRGSRMRNLTLKKPKCLIELSGRYLLDWQKSSLKKANINEILIVTGYQNNKIEKLHPLTIHNARWQTTNMVKTLSCAQKFLKEDDCIISYSDIVFHPEIINALAHAKGDIVITYDILWQKLWNLRFKDPLSDAETFKIKNNKLIEIGKKTLFIKNIQGQFMGLIKTTPFGWKIIQKTLNNLQENLIDKIDFTTLLNIIIKKNIVNIVPIEGNWCEIDTKEDLFLYEKQLKLTDKWSHDWR